MMNQWIEALQSADAGARSQALQELRALGPAARTAVPALIAALEKAGDDHKLASAIADALGAIGPDARAAAPLLDGHPRALLQIGAEPARERLALRSLLKTSEGSSWD